MTAEEILEKHGFKITCHIEESDVINEIFVKPLIEAMEEYAEQRIREELIEFAKWIYSDYPDIGKTVDKYLKQRQK